MIAVAPRCPALFLSPSLYLASPRHGPLSLSGVLPARRLVRASEARPLRLTALKLSLRCTVTAAPETQNRLGRGLGPAPGPGPGPGKLKPDSEGGSRWHRDHDPRGPGPLRLTVRLRLPPSPSHWQLEAERPGSSSSLARPNFTQVHPERYLPPRPLRFRREDSWKCS
eukprot:1512803-Rhodomonas_salina.2